MTSGKAIFDEGINTHFTSHHLKEGKTNEKKIETEREEI
jgi:hypothetical protein